MKKNLLRYVNTAIKEYIYKADFLISMGRGKEQYYSGAFVILFPAVSFDFKLATSKVVQDI